MSARVMQPKSLPEAWGIGHLCLALRSGRLWQGVLTVSWKEPYRLSSFNDSRQRASSP